MLGLIGAHVACAADDNAIGETEGLQQAFSMCGQAFKLIHGIFGQNELDDLDLVELVHTNQAAGVAAGGSGLAAEAGGIRRDINGQLLGFENRCV